MYVQTQIKLLHDDESVRASTAVTMQRVQAIRDLLKCGNYDLIAFQTATVKHFPALQARTED